MVRAALIVATALHSAHPSAKRQTAAPAADALHRDLAAAQRDHYAQVTDKFAAVTVQKSTIGQPFRLTIPFSNGDVSGGSMRYGASYHYNDGTLRLQLAKRPLAGGFEGSHPELIEIVTRYVATGGYIGQNGFGAKTRVAVRHDQTDALALIDGPEPDAQAVGITTIRPDVYAFSREVAGPEARALALGSEAVIEGTISALPGGSPTACDTSYAAPDIEDPIEVFGTRCWVGASIKRIAFVRKSSGEVLREWLP